MARASPKPEKTESESETKNSAPGKTESKPEKENSVPEKIEIAKAKCLNRTYKKAYTVNSPDGELVMRADAGATMPEIKTLKNGEKVTCYGYYSTNGSTIWLYVVDKTGQEGFVSKKYLK